MNKKNSTDALNEAISLLESKQKEELSLIKEQFHLTYESLKPINLIQSTLQEAVASPSIKSNIIANVIGLTAGYVSKKIFVGKSQNPFRKALGTLLQITVTNVVAKNADKIITFGENTFQRIRKYREKNKDEKKLLNP
jgi:hypothetical protein